MASIRSKPALVTLRAILSELRQQSSSGKLGENTSAKYVIEQFHKYKTTDEQLCKAREEMLYAAKTYLCYVQSSRKYHSINIDYSGKGERSVEETANLVGFKLPHDPK